MTRTEGEFNTVRDLSGRGLRASEIARLTGLPRTTVRDWQQGRFNDTRRRRDDAVDGCGEAHDFAILPVQDYSYLLGLYLGDGCISRHPRGVFRLRITLDVRYPQIIAECGRAIEAVMPGQHSYTLRRAGCVEVSMYSRHWPCLFPQHGPGRKHARAIRLEKWQINIVRRDTQSFVRGLIHSDGCRIAADDRGVKSVRYHFSNLSEDIKALFCDALDRLSIRWTRPCDRQIAIYRKEAVARLDQFIGPKR